MPLLDANCPLSSFRFWHCPARVTMEIFKASLEIITFIADTVHWVAGKFTRRPKSAPQPSSELEIHTNSSLLSLALKPLEPFLLLFTKHNVILLSLLLAAGVMIKLSWAHLGVFLVGIIFILAGAGHWVLTRKELEATGCLYYLLSAGSAFAFLAGVLLAGIAVLAVFAGLR
jgi:hypothetical protein